MLNVMYHYVGEREDLKGISIKKFNYQLDKLTQKYKTSEFSLTFDHGTIDHYTNVAPELDKRGIKSYFFILSMIPEEKKMPIEDKQRKLEVLYRKELAKMLCKNLNIQYNPSISKNYLNRFYFYSLEERYLRYLRDKQISLSNYKSFIDNLFSKEFGKEASFVEKNYMSWENISDLNNRGHIIGSHSHYHIGNKEDYSKSIELIKKKINKKVKCISYPNGKKNISDEDLIDLGIETAYTTEPKKSFGSFQTTRVDCNQLNL